MSSDPADTPVRPDFQTPKTIGVLNIVFAAGLILGGLGLNFAFLGVPLFSYVANMAHDNLANLARKREEQQAKLRVEEAAAPDEATRAELRARLADLESRDIELDDSVEGSITSVAGDSRFRNPRYISHFAADLASGVILNLFMLVAGVGLVLRKAWGRSLAVAVAWLKLARLAALAWSMTMVVAPIASGFFRILEQAMPVPGTDPDGPRIALLLVSLAGGMALFGAIYPVVTITMLRRPEVRAVFRSQPPQ